MSLAFDDKNHLSKNRLIPDLLTCKLEELSILDKTTLFSKLSTDRAIKNLYMYSVFFIYIFLYKRDKKGLLVYTATNIFQYKYVSIHIKTLIGDL